MCNCWKYHTSLWHPPNQESAYEEKERDRHLTPLGKEKQFIMQESMHLCCGFGKFINLSFLLPMCFCCSILSALMLAKEQWPTFGLWNSHLEFPGQGIRDAEKCFRRSYLEERMFRALVAWYQVWAPDYQCVVNRRNALWTPSMRCVPGLSHSFSMRCEPPPCVVYQVWAPDSQCVWTPMHCVREFILVCALVTPEDL